MKFRGTVSADAFSPTIPSDFGSGGIKTDNIEVSTATTGSFVVKLQDNVADALNIKEGTNSYLKFVTTDASEAIVATKAITASGGVTGNLTGNVTGNVTGNLTGTASALSGTAAITNETDAPGASTAAAGTTTTDAGVLPSGTAKVYPTTAADGTKGVRVSATDKVTGRLIFIGNGVPNAILKVYAPSGGVINGAAADAAFSSVSGKGVIMYCLSSGSNAWLAW